MVSMVVFQGVVLGNGDILLNIKKSLGTQDHSRNGLYPKDHFGEATLAWN